MDEKRTFKKFLHGEKHLLVRSLCGAYRDHHLFEIRTFGFADTDITLVPLFSYLSPQQRYEIVCNFMRGIFCKNTRVVPRKLVFYSFYLTLFKVLETSIERDISKFIKVEKKPSKEFENKEFLFPKSYMNDEDVRNDMSAQELVRRNLEVNKRMTKSFERGYIDILKVKRRRMKDLINSMRGVKKMKLKDLRKSWEKVSEKYLKKLKSRINREEFFILVKSEYSSFKIDKFELTWATKIVNTIKSMFGKDKVSPTLKFCLDMSIWKRIIRFVRPYFFKINPLLEVLLVGDLNEKKESERFNYISKLIQKKSKEYEKTYDIQKVYLSEIMIISVDQRILNYEACLKGVGLELCHDKENFQKNNDFFLKFHTLIIQKMSGIYSSDNVIQALDFLFKNGNLDFIPKSFALNLDRRKKTFPQMQQFHGKYCNFGVNFLDYHPREQRKMRKFSVCSYCGKREEKFKKFKRCGVCKVE